MMYSRLQLKAPTVFTVTPWTSTNTFETPAYCIEDLEGRLKITKEGSTLIVPWDNVLGAIPLVLGVQKPGTTVTITDPDIEVIRRALDLAHNEPPGVVTTSGLEPLAPPPPAPKKARR